MTRPINIYNLSRINNKDVFNRIQVHASQNSNSITNKNHEIKSLKILVNYLINSGLTIQELDGFFYSYNIPQIGKEFDLLKFNDKYCLNIELKSEINQNDPKNFEIKILNQLIKNRYYLLHLSRKIVSFAIITSTMTCYQLTIMDTLEKIDFNDIVKEIKKYSTSYLKTIDEFFKPSKYLISPLNTPEKFIENKYFLTQSQENIKKNILSSIQKNSENTFFHITGKPGTGKTLLLYDIAKLLAKTGSTLIIHCGKLSEGQIKINDGIQNLNIISAKELNNNTNILEKYSFLIIDEVHRIYLKNFYAICDSVLNNNQACLFFSDPGQILSSTEQQNDIVNKIKSLNLISEFSLTEKIRMNEELYSFILSLKNLNYKSEKNINYSNIDINYANDIDEAKQLIEYYKSKKYKFINYSKSNYNNSPYSKYNDLQDADTHHIIGQEFDKVLLIMDKSFYYDKNNILQSLVHPNPDYLYTQLLYQHLTRAREKIALIIVDAPDLFEKISSILDNEIIYFKKQNL